MFIKKSLGFNLLRYTLTCASLGIVTSAWADKLMARKDATVVTLEAKTGSEKIASLKKGETVEAIERQGMYWQVLLSDGKKGFVKGLDIVRVQAAESAALQETRQELRPKSDLNSPRARSSSAVMGIRGLDDNDASAAADVKPDMRRIYVMEDRAVAEEKVSDLEQSVNTEIGANSPSK